MKLTHMTMSLIALTLFASSFAQGGPPQGGPPGGPGGFGGPGMMQGGPGGRSGNDIQLLTRKDVQDDLQLTADQKAKVTELAQKYSPRRGGGPGGPGQGGPGQGGQGGPPRNGGGGQGGPPQDFDPEAMRAEMEKRQAEQKKAIASVLSEAQVKRLGEIKVQMQGSMAALDPETQKKLEITDDQKDKIEVAMEEQRENMRPPDFGNGERPDPKQMQDQMKKMQEKMNAAIDAILTTNQKARLRELGGKAFKRVDPQPGQGQGRGGGGRTI